MASAASIEYMHSVNNHVQYNEHLQGDDGAKKYHCPYHSIARNILTVTIYFQDMLPSAHPCFIVGDIIEAQYFHIMPIRDGWYILGFILKAITLLNRQFTRVTFVFEYWFNCLQMASIEQMQQEVQVPKLLSSLRQKIEYEDDTKSSKLKTIVHYTDDMDAKFNTVTV